ncbi:hypothetical protein JL720_10209 [Aureococcus anophagefferens]|nr:hypothetical protein JL720_10209 [Aureococcus anophagefferens]
MAYAPPTFDEATGMMAEPAMEANVMQVGLNPAPRQGVSRGSGDAYAQLADDDEDDALATRERRASDIALARQQAHANAFKRQMEAEEEFARSSHRRHRTAELAAPAAGTDQNLDMEALSATQRDAMLAARLQAEFNQGQGAGGASRGETEDRPRARAQERQARRLLAVATPTTGKFAVEVPTWAKPNTHFDCVVTTIAERRRGAAVRAWNGDGDDDDDEFHDVSEPEVVAKAVVAKAVVAGPEAPPAPRLAAKYKKRDDASAAIGRKLLQGWTLLDAPCPRDGCVGCP